MKILKNHVARELLHGDGEIGAVHLGFQDSCKMAPGLFSPDDSKMILFLVSRGEKREALDVIPMGMRDQEAEIERRPLEFLGQGASKESNAGPRIEHDDFSIRAYFDARGVAADESRGGPGGGD